MNPELTIRKFETKDRAALRQIVYDTALMGETGGLFFQGQEVLSDALSLYFTDYEPESCFVAETNGQIIAYLIGARSQLAAEKVFNGKIAIPLLFKTLKSGALLKLKNLNFISRCLTDLLINGIKTPNFNRQYPATFHLNVKDGFRGQGAGSKLIASYLAYLKNCACPGVHLATMSKRAQEFFLSQGFEQLYQGKRSYFRQVLARDVPLYILGKFL